MLDVPQLKLRLPSLGDLLRVALVGEAVRLQVPQRLADVPVNRTPVDTPDVTGVVAQCVNAVPMDVELDALLRTDL